MPPTKPNPKQVLGKETAPGCPSPTEHSLAQSRKLPCMAGCGGIGKESKGKPACPGEAAALESAAAGVLGDGAPVNPGAPAKH